MKPQKKVIIVGAGAAGLMAAITAARNGAKVTVLEHMNFSARKIEHTGNGKCNYTNSHQLISCYNSGNSETVKSVLEKFSWQETIEFFEELGVVPREKDGYFYPLSGQATSISSVLRMEAASLNVKIACNIQIKQIVKEQNIFKVVTDGYVYECDSLILATGSKAAPVTGSDGSGYDYAKSLGHSIEAVYPALVSLKCSGKELNLLSGLRNYGKVSLYINDTMCVAEEGEIQFIKSGISGIPVFQLSRFASVALNSKSKNDVRIFMDFLPMYDEQQLKSVIEKRLVHNGYKNLTGFLTGLLHEKVISVIALRSQIKGNVTVNDFTKFQWDKICSIIKNMEFKINGTGDFSSAQVCCGGVSLSELTDDLMSRKVNSLYFAGEILDVDGRCGGYNLQWAWSSGFVAGTNASM